MDIAFCEINSTIWSRNADKLHRCSNQVLPISWKWWVRYYLLRRSAKWRIRDAQECIKVDIFETRLGTQSPGFIQLFEEVTRAELGRDNSRSLQFRWFNLWLIRGRKTGYFGFPGVWTDTPLSPVKSCVAWIFRTFSTFFNYSWIIN